MQFLKQKRRLWIFAFIFMLLPVPVAAQSASSNYQVEEAIFGTGGEVNLNSNNYNAFGSAGALGVGLVSSSNYDAEAGFLSSSEPFLAMIVNAATVDLGTLTPNAVSSGSASFSVRTYLSSAYSVQTLSLPPTSEGGAQLTALSSPSASSPGTEQFGINLVDNSSPDVGADPSNDPDNTFADGKAATGYDTTDTFKYNAGDTIAQSPTTAGKQAVGQTTYTISYIANINPITAAGLYTMRHELMAVATY